MKTLFTSILTLALATHAQAERIPDYPELLAPAGGDLLLAVDISDVTNHATGSSKKLTLSALMALSWQAPGAMTNKTYNGLTITTSTGTLTMTNGKTLTVSNTITLAGTDSSTLNIGAGGTLGSAAFTASTAYAASDATLTGLAALAPTSGQGIYASGADTFSTYTLTAGGRALGGAAGTADTFPYFSASNTVSLAPITAQALSLLDDTTAGDMRATLGANKVEIGIACSDETTAIETGTAKATFRMPHALTLTGVRASVNGAPTGSTIIVNVKEGGSTIFSTKVSIDASETTSTTAATPAVISDTALADDAVITVDIDQVGSSTPGTGLKIWLIGTRP